MKGKNARPATYAQRSFLKKYGKRTGGLRSAAPKIDNRPASDVTCLLEVFAGVIRQVDSESTPDLLEGCCGRDNHPCCCQPFELQLIESINFYDYESLQYFQRVLMNTGVIDALRDAGINEGDTVNMYDLEFDFVE